MVGSNDRTGELVKKLRPTLVAPVISVNLNTPIDLPPVWNVGTLVLNGVDMLQPPDQRRLMQWLDAAEPHPRVISTSTVRLTPLVAEGTFLKPLYYRLNLFYVEVT